MSIPKQPNPEGADNEENVGYGKPPKHSRFKPGHSGNPKGRPRGVHNFRTDLKATLKMPVKVTRDGKPHNISTQKAALLRMREKALSGVTRELLQLIVLAQAHNNEELAEASSLSANDAKILQIFKARLLSGAVAAHDAVEADENLIEGSPSSTSSVLEKGAETTASRKARSKRRVRSTHKRKARPTQE